ncbi:MAG: hypothetical protein M0C28_37160 [Candidatus Moduliflexus flocculans]|nr:hypothetical protein [Candidatus Moduliflexus flocculans]
MKNLIFQQISEIGSFEQQLPSYWTKPADLGGATLSWAADESHSMGKITKDNKDCDISSSDVGVREYV